MSLKQFCSDNHMMINDIKTKIMCFGSKDTIDIDFIMALEQKKFIYINILAVLYGLYINLTPIGVSKIYFFQIMITYVIMPEKPYSLSNEN